MSFHFLGRKEPLKEIREKLLNAHKKYMRLNDDEFYDDMDSNILVTEFNRLDMEIPEKDGAIILKKLQRQRHLMFWHDGSTISNHGHILIMVLCLYDKAIHLTDQEFYEKYGT